MCVKVFMITIIYIVVVGLTNLNLYSWLGEYTIENAPYLFSGIETIEYVFYFLILYLLRHYLGLKRIVLNGSPSKNMIVIISLSILSIILVDFIYNFKYIFVERDNYIYADESVNSVSMYVYYLVNTILFTSILEEVVFRGIILERLLSKLNVVTSVLFSTILFSLIHLDFFSLALNANFISSFVTGILLGIIYYRYGLFYSVLFHASFNLLTLIINSNQKEYWQVIGFLDFNIGYWLIEVMALVFIFIILKGGISNILTKHFSS